MQPRAAPAPVAIVSRALAQFGHALGAAFEAPATLASARASAIVALPPDNGQGQTRPLPMKKKGMSES